MVSLSEERLILLEHTIATMQTDFLLKLSENTSSMMAVNKLLREQELKQLDANHQITILTGVIGSQGQDIKAIKLRLDSVDHRLDSMDHHLDKVDQRLDKVDQRLDKVDQRLDSMDQHLSEQGQDIKEIKQGFSEVLRLLTTLADKTNG